MNCPNCGSENIQALSEVTTDTDIKGYGCCKGGIGYLIFGPIGFLCGLCGMGKGRSRNSVETIWMCRDCGNKFR